MVTSGIPADVDAETHRRIARSFYVVTMLRLSALLGFALVFLVVTLATHESRVAAMLLGALVLALVSLQWRTRRRWRASAASWE